LAKPVPPISWSWPVCIFWVWLAGAAVLLGHVLISSIRLAWRCAKLRPLTEPAAVAVLEDCRARLAMRAQLVMVESGEVGSPALHGLFRPRLLLPKGFTAKFSPDEQRFVFLHELAHLKRRDLWMNWVMALLQAAHWFNPLVWLAFARWRGDRELACDTMVLEAAGAEQNKEYGQTILRLLENFTRPLPTPGLVGILEDKRQLRRRIGMIAAYAPSSRGSLLAAVLIAALTVIGLTDARSDDSTGSPSSAAASDSGIQLTIELRDGSRVVGKTVEDTLSFHSGALGDMKLSWAGIRSIEYAADTGAARLTATNGDGFSVQLAADTLRLETGFGKTELPVKLIRSIKIASPARLNNPKAPGAAGEAGSRLTIELRDGSHVVGKGLDDAVGFHSAAMGDLKLAWPGIRSVEFAAAGTDTAHLTATNGDVYEVQFTAPAVRVETSFGKTELPVKLIRSIKVAAMTKPGQLPAGLVALWSGEGDGNDSAGGNNMTLTDITFAQGKVGQAFSFNGTSSYIDIPDNPALDVGAGEGFTVTAWIKPSRVDGIYMGVEWCDYLCIFSIGKTPSDHGVLLASIYDSNRNNHFLQAGSGTIVPNVFQHIAVTFDKASGLGVLYVNGTVVTQSHFDNIVPLTKGGLRIGYRPSNPGDWTYNRFFTGLMDEITIYNRALSASEIQAICTEQNNGEPLPTPTPAPGAMPFNSMFSNGGGTIGD
jgi:beta-lactamase regulating signal transducer with metallopeptidase domain